MPSKEKGFVYSVTRREEELIKLLTDLFTQDYLIFIENPANPAEFGGSKIPDSIKFPGFLFDSKKEARWYTKDGMFFVTIISDEPIRTLPELEGNWTREKIAEDSETYQREEVKGIILIDPDLLHINVQSRNLSEYLSRVKILEDAELFSIDSMPIFVTLRGGRK